MGKVEIVCLFVLMLNVSQQFFNYVRREPLLPGYYQCFKCFYISFYVNCVSVPHNFVKSRKMGYYFMYIFRFKNAWKKSNGGAK